MADQPANETLNHLASRAYRGLLQYAVECWPWTDASTAAEQQAIEQLAARQQSFVGRLVNLLSERGEAIDLGNFPDYSELHYVSVDFLVQKLIADEQGLVAELESALGT